MIYIFFIFMILMIRGATSHSARGEAKGKKKLSYQFRIFKA